MLVQILARLDFRHLDLMELTKSVEKSDIIRFGLLSPNCPKMERFCSKNIQNRNVLSNLACLTFHFQTDFYHAKSKRKGMDLDVGISCLKSKSVWISDIHCFLDKKLLSLKN